MAVLSPEIWGFTMKFHSLRPVCVPYSAYVTLSSAHSVTFGMTDTNLTLRTVKRGKAETTGLSIDNLNWAIGAAELCSIFFLRIEGRLGSTDTWGELYGFPER